MYLTRPAQWWTRYHQLGRKIEKNGSVPTVHDCRVAAILRQQATHLTAMLGSDVRLDDAVASMEWVIEYGQQATRRTIAAYASQGKDVGTSDGRVHGAGGCDAPANGPL